MGLSPESELCFMSARHWDDIYRTTGLPGKSRCGCRPGFAEEVRGGTPHPPPLLSIKVGVTLPPKCRAVWGAPPSQSGSGRGLPYEYKKTASLRNSRRQFHAKRWFWPCRKKRFSGTRVGGGTPPPPSPSFDQSGGHPPPMCRAVWGVPPSPIRSGRAGFFPEFPACIRSFLKSPETLVNFFLESSITLPDNFRKVGQPC